MAAVVVANEEEVVEEEVVVKDVMDADLSLINTTPIANDIVPASPQVCSESAFHHIQQTPI